jgi:hypothetical protein
VRPVVAERRKLRRAAVVGVALAALLVALYGWFMLRMTQGPKIRWSATAMRNGEDLVVTISGKNQFFWEVGGVTLLEASLDGQPVQATALPLVFGEFAPRRSKSATLRFALPEDGSPERTLELVVTEKGRGGKGPTMHTIVLDSGRRVERD